MGFASVILLALAALTGPAHARWGKPESCAYDYSRIYGVSEGEAGRLKENGGYLAELPGALLGDRDERAREVFAALEREPRPRSPRTRRVLELSRGQVDRLFADVRSIPQVMETNLCEQYRGSAKRGFCFGRAVAAHLKALQHGIHNRSVRKLFAVGPLEMDGESWRYHVTTIVRVKGGEWYALDPTFDRALPVADWYRRMKEHDPSRTMRLYSTPASRLGMVSDRAYAKESFEQELFNGFFRDLLAEIRKGNGKTAREPPARWREENKKWLMGAGGVGGISAAGLYELYRLSREKK